MEGFQPVRLAYNTHEPETGTDGNLAPIIYLHGITDAKECWSDIPQIVANATKRKSYSLDARNHGDSGWSEVFNFEVNVDDVIHFLDTLGIQKAILVGHSMGGITAIRTALKMPGRVESVVIEDMRVRTLSKDLIDDELACLRLMDKSVVNVPPGLDETETRKAIYKFFVANIPPKLAEDMKGKDGNVKDAIDLRLLKRNDQGHYSLRCNVEVLEKFLLGEEGMAFKSEGIFHGPAFFMYGTDSHLGVEKDEQHIKQFFPKAIFKGIAADHSIHAHNPEKFTESLLEFLF